MSSRLPPEIEPTPTMRIWIASTAILAGAVVGLAAGLAWRHAHVAGPVQPAKTPVGHASPSMASVAPQKASTPDDSPLATQLALDLAESSGVKRWLFWWNAIEKATPADFPRLAKLARGNRGATRLIAERWAELAPKHFFDTLRAASAARDEYPPELADTLLQSWLKQDKSAVIAALKDGENFPKRMDWRRQLATTLMDTDPETGLRLMSEWHIENFGPGMSGVNAWAAADPRHAAEFTIANPAGFASESAMATIGEVWAKADPAAALAFAATQRGSLANKLSQTVLKSWADRDLSGAADWLAASDTSTLAKFSPAFVEAWAQQDAPGALAWCQANLTGTSLTDSIKALAEGASQKNVASAAALVSSMTPSNARSQAAMAVADKWFPDAFANKTVSADTLNWLSSLDSDAIRQVVSSVSWKWTDTDPSSLASFLQSATNISFPTYTYETLARTMARNDPTAAMDWANRLPSQLGVSAGSSAFSEWARGQFDVAMQWFNQMPPSDSRREPFLNSLLQQLAWDPQADARFGQIASLAPSAARSAIQGMALPEARRAALLALVSPQAGR